MTYDPLQYRTLNPATGVLSKTYASLDDAAADAVLARAHTAYSLWSSMSLKERLVRVVAFADLLEKNADRIGRQVATEMGKPLGRAVAEAGIGASMLRYYIQHAQAILSDRPIEVGGFSRVVTRVESMGVVLGVEPWNSPVYQAVRVIAPNVVLGNTVIVKPAEITPGSTLILDELMAQAGFPEGVYTTAMATRSQVSRWIADSRVRAIAFTGSDRTGSVIGELAGRNIKPVVLELGGSDAFVVLDSADLEAASQCSAQVRLAINGQMCISPKRVIVTQKVADEFIRQYCAVFAAQVVGDPLDSRTMVGPLASQDVVNTLQGQYQDALDKGAIALVPGGRMAGPGSYFRPAVLTNVTPDMRLYREEAFGPLGIVHRVPDADAAVALANATRYGLGGTVFGRDLEEAQRVARALDTGMVGINRFMGGPVEIPFGGTKASGVGRELGRSGMDMFANLKTYGWN